MEPVDRNEPGGEVSKILNPLGGMKIRSSRSKQKVWKYSVPDIQPEPQVGWLTPLRLDGFSRFVRRPIQVIQSSFFSYLNYTRSDASRVSKFHRMNSQRSKT